MHRKIKSAHEWIRPLMKQAECLIKFSFWENGHLSFLFGHSYKDWQVYNWNYYEGIDVFQRNFLAITHESIIMSLILAKHMKST